MTEPEPTLLRADARRLLAHWREADDMPVAARRRVLRRLTEPRAVAAPERRANPWTWIVAVAAALILVWWIGAPRARDARAVPAPAGEQAAAIDDAGADPSRARTTPAPAAVLPPAELPPPADATPVPQRPTPSARPRSESAVPQPSITDASTLERERVLIEQAWHAVATGDPAGALARVDEHARHFPEGVLAPERRAVAIVARCIRRDADAEARATTWLAAEPRSPLATRVRAACNLPAP